MRIPPLYIIISDFDGTPCVSGDSYISFDDAVDWWSEEAEKWGRESRLFLADPTEAYFVDVTASAERELQRRQEEAA